MSTPPAIIHIAIVEDDNDILEYVKEIINLNPDTYCQHCYHSAEQFLHEVNTLVADVVLMDITLPEMNGIDCVKHAKQLRPDIQFMMFTSHNDAEKTFQSLCNGATGYLLKHESESNILQSIRDIHKGGSPMSTEIARIVVNSLQKKQSENTLLDSFTAREQQILIGLSKGMSYKELAATYFISIETVRTYLRKIYEKLQVHSKVEALNKVFPR